MSNKPTQTCWLIASILAIAFLAAGCTSVRAVDLQSDDPEARAQIERLSGVATAPGRESGPCSGSCSGSNRRLEFELGEWSEGACGFAYVLALSQMREHRLGPFGRADLHPRHNPFDRQGRFAPQPGGAGQLAGVAVRSLRSKVQSPKLGWEPGLLPALAQRRERFLVAGLRTAAFHLPLELQTPRCGVLPIDEKFDVVGFAHGACLRFPN